MNIRSLGVFALGFAAGTLCVCLLMWSAGVFRTPAAGLVHVAAPASIPGPEVPPPALSDFKAPALHREPLPAGNGEADRLAVEPGTPRTTGRLAVPVRGVTLTDLRDTFADARGGHKHEALDISAPRGTPVVAAAEGNVAKLFTSKQGGLTVYQFDDSGTWCYYYAHLDHYAPSLKEGMLLRKGDVLGYVGTTGDAPPNAPHLHFAIFRLGPEKAWWKGTAVNPLPVLQGVPAEH
jgi:murein DD-endopeptidase MepM/ murein hydrolase activator NlpD